MIDNHRVFRFEVKTRFRFSSEEGVGEKTRFGGGRFVIGTPSLPLHKPFLSLSHYINILSSPLLHKPFLSLPYHINLFHLSHHICPSASFPFLTQTLSHPPLPAQHKKNRIDGNQSYLKHYLIDLFN